MEFLHTHPAEERKYGIPAGHVIVDAMELLEAKNRLAELDRLRADRALHRQDQDKRTRHACAEAITSHAASVIAANSFRGRVNRGAEFAVEQLEKAAQLCINIEVGP